MRITKLFLKNYKKFQDTEINFDRNLTVFIGRNNAGKSSLLEALALVLFNRHVEAHNILLSKKDHPKGTGTVNIKCYIKLDEKEWDRAITLANLHIDQHIKLPEMSEMLGIPLFIERTFSYLENSLASSSGARVLIDYDQLKLEEPKRNAIVNIVDRLNQSINQSMYVFSNLFYLSGDSPVISTERLIPFNEFKINPNRSDLIRNELFLLKQREKGNYDKIMDRIGEFFPELDEIQLDHNYDTGNLDLSIKEEQYFVGLEQMGSGIKRIIQILARILSSQSTVVILDEPEIHMHPRLIKSFVDCINEVSDVKMQLIISTHNEIFIDSVDPNNILYIKPTSSVTAQINYLQQTESDITTVLRDLEIFQDNFSKFEASTSQAIVFAEGPTDWEFINAFAKRLGLHNELKRAHIHFVPLGGNRPINDHLVKVLSTYHIPYVILYDRDERTQNEIDFITQHIPSNKVHYLKKREFENYMIDIKSIVVLLNNHISKNTGTNSNLVSEQYVNEKIKLLSMPYKDKVIIKRFVEKIYSQLNLNFLRPSERSSFINANLTKTNEDIINSLSSMLLRSIQKYDPTVLHQILENEMNSIKGKWDNYFLDLCPGKDLLNEIRKWIQVDYNISGMSNNDFVNMLTDVDIEIRELITKIINIDK